VYGGLHVRFTSFGSYVYFRRTGVTVELVAALFGGRHSGGSRRSCTRAPEEHSLTGTWNMGYPTPALPTEEPDVPNMVHGPPGLETISSADAETQAAVTAQLEALALQGAVVARGAVDLASLRTAEAAEAARRTKALAVAASASAVADTAARTAVAVQLQADASAVAVADAATRAARLVAARFPEADTAPAQAASLLSATVSAAAAERARATADAAAIVADAVADAATAAASTAAASATAVEHEVVTAAAAVLALADKTAQELARVNVSLAADLAQPAHETAVEPTTRTGEVEPDWATDTDTVPARPLEPSRHVTAEYLG
jgi:hypothetical protein